MSILAIATYKPKTGRENDFLKLLTNHIPTLHSEKLISSKDNYVMHSKNGTIIEIFEWLSREAVDKAYETQCYGSFWQQIGERADVVSLNSLEETGQPFAGFKIINI